jgi:8-oxo-dGTP pyrophosphatase MutT (NUDIX family)
MTYLSHILACNDFNLDHFKPFVIEKTAYGWIKPEFEKHLSRWSDIFCISDSRILLNPKLSSYQQRSEAIAPVFKQLYKEKIISSWVGEPYPVTLKYKQPPQLEIERVACQYMGLKTFGVHMNGLVQKPDGVYVWVGLRAKDKPYFPGRLDQMVAGGQPIGISRKDNIIKEAAEEANVPLELANQASTQGQISYCMESSRGLVNTTLFLFDLWLPEDFVPVNTDGEMESFTLMPLAEMAQITDTTENFKTNCNLVNIDLLLRQGYIKQTHQDYKKIQKLLYK